MTVASDEAPEAVELLLEPNAHPAAKAYQEAIFADGIPATAFFVDDITAEVKRLEAQGVSFRMQPTEMGEATIATFDDTCGNYIQLVEEMAKQR